MDSEALEFMAHRNKLNLRKGTKGRPEEQVRGWLGRGEEVDENESRREKPRTGKKEGG